MSITLTIPAGLEYRMQKLRAFLNNKGDIQQVVGRALSQEVRDHLIAYSQTHPNRLGGRRSHYYAQAARTVRYQTDNEGVTVAISQVGMALHYYGGVVKPVTAKLLTIPAIAEAYGRRAREFGNLHFVRFKSGAMALVEDKEGAKDARSGRGIARKRGSGASKGRPRVFYWLARSTTHRPNKRIVPNRAELLRTSRLVISAYLRQIGASR